MRKKVISLNDVKAECESKTVFYIYIIFAIIGMVVVLSMLKNLLQNYNTSNLIGFIVFSFIFGGFFGYFLGIRNIVYSLRRSALVKNGEIWFVIDEVTDKYYSTNGSDGSVHKDFQLELKKYSAKTNKRIFLRNRKEFNNVHEGDSCILGFTKLSKKPFCVFAGQHYELDTMLQDKVIEDIK